MEVLYRSNLLSMASCKISCQHRMERCFTMFSSTTVFYSTML